MTADAKLFKALGIHWDRDAMRLDVPRHELKRVIWRFQKSMPQFVWEAAQFEGNPHTFPEVQTLLDGVTVGGSKLSDTQQILGLRDGMRWLTGMVREGTFEPSRKVACILNGLIARDEALEWGVFRGEGKELANVSVRLGAATYLPKPTLPGGRNLIRSYAAGLAALRTFVENPFERALALKLFMCREQFFFDGNKRTARAMMNGELMRHGYDGLSIPVARKLDYNGAMAEFNPAGDAAAMMLLLAKCHPEAGPLLASAD